MNKLIDKIIKCDVVVVGAGVSGVCAAISAARNNLQVLIVEKNRYLGGVATRCMHKAVCGLYGNELREKTDIDNTLNKGIPQELVRFLKTKHNITEIKRIGKVFVLPLPDNSLVAFLAYLLKDEKNMTALLSTEVYEIDKQENRVISLRAKRNEKSINIFPKIVIDCSGNSIVSKLAEIPFFLVNEEEQQLCGYTAKIGTIRNADESLLIKIPYFAEKFVSAAGAPAFLKYTTFIQGDTPNEGYLKMNIPYSKRDSKEEYLLTLFEFISEHLPELKNARIEKTSEEIFTRDGARLKGEYLLTSRNILEAKKFEDGVVKGAWPIEQWLEGKGTFYQYVKENDYYEIPRRCLKSKIINNLIAAGKCISVSSEALGSTRVIGICISLGETSGRLAWEMIQR